MAPTFEDWCASVPPTIASDPLWRMEIVRWSTWAGVLAIADAASVRRVPACYRIADQLARAAGSVSANLWEGLWRPSALDRARYVTIALGSLRETQAWYLMTREAFPAEQFEDRMQLLLSIRRMLRAILRNHYRRIPARAPR
jgi:four helix bundle protein